MFADGGSGRVWMRTSGGSIDYGAPILTGAFGLADMTFVTEPNGTFLYYTLNGSSSVRKLGVVATPVPQTLQVQVTGVAGVPGTVDAVVMNMTAVTARTAGFATIYPCGQTRPTASNLNFVAGQTVANLVIAKPGTNGKVCIYSDTTIDVLADVTGYFPTGSDFTPITNPTRILDTRNGIGAPTTPLTANQTLELSTTGVAGVPGTVDAVVMNMTAVTARTAGFATIYPCGQTRPTASNLNFVAGQTVANLVIAKPGTNGKVCIYSDTTIDVLADVTGYFPTGSDFTPITNPTRILDTRNGIGAPTTPLTANQTLELSTTGVAGVPGTVDAVVMNMTAVTARTAGFATIYPCGQTRPTASNLNFVAGQTVANLVIAKPGTNGKVCIYSDTTIDVLADVTGYFPTGSDFTPITNPTRILDTRNGIGA